MPLSSIYPNIANALPNVLSIPTRLRTNKRLSSWNSGGLCPATTRHEWHCGFEVQPAYQSALPQQCQSDRQGPRCQAGRHSCTGCPSARAGRCWRRGGSGRGAPRPDSPPQLSSGGTSSAPHTAPPSPARGAGAPARDHGTRVHTSVSVVSMTMRIRIFMTIKHLI